MVSKFSKRVWYVRGLLLMAIIMVVGIVSGTGFGWSDLSTAAPTGITAVGVVLVGIFLWMRSSWLATKMVPSDSSGDAVRLDYQAVMSVAFTAIGVWTLIPSIRDLASDTSRIAMEVSSLPTTGTALGRQAFGRPVIGLGFALWLIFGSRGISRIVSLFADPTFTLPLIRKPNNRPTMNPVRHQRRRAEVDGIECGINVDKNSLVKAPGWLVASCQETSVKKLPLGPHVYDDCHREVQLASV